MSNFNSDNKILATVAGIEDLNDRAAEQCSGGFTYTVNLYSGKDGTGDIVKSIDVTEKSGYDIEDYDVHNGDVFGLNASSFLIDAEADGDGYRVTAFTNHTSQSSTVDPNRAYNFTELNGLGLRDITVNKVNTSYRSPIS